MNSILLIAHFQSGSPQNNIQLAVIVEVARRHEPAGAMKSNFFSAESKLTAAFFPRFDKLDVLFTGFIVFALIIEALRVSVNRP